MSVSPPPSRLARRSKKAAASAFRGDDAAANASSLPGFERADEACETARPEVPTGVFDEDAAAAALALASIDVPPGLGPRIDAATPDLFAEEDSSPEVDRTGGGSTVGSAGRGEAGTTRVEGRPESGTTRAAAFAFPSRPVDPSAAAAFAKDFAAGSRGDVPEALPGVDRARAVASARAFIVVVVGGGDEDVAAGLFDGDAPDEWYTNADRVNGKYIRGVKPDGREGSPVFETDVLRCTGGASGLTRSGAAVASLFAACLVVAFRRDVFS